MTYSFLRKFLAQGFGVFADTLNNCFTEFPLHPFDPDHLATVRADLKGVLVVRKRWPITPHPCGLDLYGPRLMGHSEAPTRFYRVTNSAACTLGPSRSVQ